MFLLFLASMKSMARCRNWQSRLLVKAFHGVAADRAATFRCELSHAAPQFTTAESVCWDVVVALI